MGAFSLKFSIAPSGETTDRIKTVKGWGAKTGRTSYITIPSMMGIVGRAPAVNEKVWCFLFVFLSRFGITKFVITETLLSSVIFKTIMVSLHRGRFVVVQLYLTFSLDPQNVPIGINLYQKLRFFFAILGGVCPRFKKPEQWNLVWGCGPGTPSPAKPNIVTSPSQTL